MPGTEPLGGRGAEGTCTHPLGSCWPPWTESPAACRPCVSDIIMFSPTYPYNIWPSGGGRHFQVGGGANQLVRGPESAAPPLGAEGPPIVLACSVSPQVYFRGQTNLGVGGPIGEGYFWEPRAPYFSGLPGFHQWYVRCNAVPYIFYSVHSPFKISGGGGGKMINLPPSFVAGGSCHPLLLPLIWPLV